MSRWYYNNMDLYDKPYAFPRRAWEWDRSSFQPLETAGKCRCHLFLDSRQREAVSVKHFLAPKRAGTPFNADFSPSLTKNNTIHKLSIYGTMI